MNKLHLAAALIIVTIGSMIAMQDNDASQQLNALEAQVNALQAFRNHLKSAVDQAADQLNKYANDEPTIFISHLLISKFNPDTYLISDIPKETSDTLKEYATMMKTTYETFTNQFENSENLVPISSRTPYTGQDYKDTYENLVEPYIASEIDRVNDEIAALE